MIAQSRHRDSAKKTTSPNMLLSPPDSPSLAAALLGTTDGEELVATDVAVDVVVEASVVLTGDGLTTLTVAVVVPELRVVVLFRVQGTVEIEVGVVADSNDEVELVSET
ncbi:hypothetical protein VPNG_01436 [Cytospora leucostoma]|uniref:Uncharacterized protein n=1 Tax=Cytospora leucostoma TaxID=1230097 RepID=A0A423XKZ2_9PEZI|nr:hypothetical protein VPNG_01436 [Cytospora leucostoma]